MAKKLNLARTKIACWKNYRCKHATSFYEDKKQIWIKTSYIWR